MPTKKKSPLPHVQGQPKIWTENQNLHAEVKRLKSQRRELIELIHDQTSFDVKLVGKKMTIRDFDDEGSCFYPGHETEVGAPHG